MLIVSFKGTCFKKGSETLAWAYIEIGIWETVISKL